MSQALRPQVFATDSAERVEEWERHNAATLIALSCRTPESFRALEVNVELPQARLALVRGSRHVVSRPAALVEEAPADAVAVYAALRGEALFDDGAGSRVIRPGQLVVCDPDRPFVRGFGHGLEELAVTVSRDRLGGVTLASPLVLDASDPYAAALVRLVGRAVRPDGAVRADEDLLVELVSVLVGGDRTGLAHRAAAKAFIEERLGDPDLSAADVAAAAGISERHLSRIFAEAGTSVPRHILARRLDTAYARLTSSAAAELRTVDVAAACGFTSAAHFSQSFRRRFGVPAGEVRRRR